MALEEIFNGLPWTRQKEYRNQAKQELEKFEDALNEQLKGKLQGPSECAPTHGELRKKEQALVQETARSAEGAGIERALELQRRERMSVYDKAYEEVVDLINRHTEGLRWELVNRGAVGMRLSGGTLLRVLWRHVQGAAVGGRVRLCARPGCGRPFICTDERQHYCPQPLLFRLLLT